MEKRESLLFLANLTGIENADTMSDISLQFDIENRMSDLTNSFYLYDLTVEEEKEEKKRNRFDDDDEDLDLKEMAEDSYLEFELAEQSGYEPHEGDASDYRYAILNALNKKDCITLYEIMRSEDHALSEMAKTAFLLSVRGSICSLIQRVHFRIHGEIRGNDALRRMRAAGIGAAMESLSNYNPTTKGSATFFSYSYVMIWQALLGEMYGYDYKNDKARTYHTRIGKIKNTITYFISKGIPNPTDAQIAAHINQSSTRGEKHALSPEMVRLLRQSSGYNEVKSLQESDGVQDKHSLNQVELEITINSIIEAMPPMQADVIRIISHLTDSGEKAPKNEQIFSLLKRRYPDASKNELENAIISARVDFKKRYFDIEYVPEAPRNPLLEAILGLEDYTDEMLNLLENTDDSNIW